MKKMSFSSDFQQEPIVVMLFWTIFYAIPYHLRTCQI